MLIDVELCHIYLNNFMADGTLSDRDRDSIERGKNYAAAARARGDEIRFSVMLDDADGAMRLESVDHLKELIESHGIVLDEIIHESDLAKFASQLVESIRPMYRFTQGLSDYLSVATGDRYMWAHEDKARVRSARDIFFDRLEGRQVEEVQRFHQYSKFWVPLRVQEEDNSVVYSCPLLTAVWYLSRLGVPGFELSGDRPRADLIVTVLPIEYLKNEAMAFEIIRLSSAARIKKSSKKIEYIFI